MAETNSQNSRHGDFDTTVRIVKPGFQYFIYGLVFFVLMVLLWSIFGKIPVKIKGKGVIVQREYESVVTSTYPGVVRQIYFKIGDSVEQGDRLIRLEQFDLDQQISEKLFEIDKALMEDSVKKVNLREEFIRHNAEVDKESSVLRQRIGVLEDESDYYAKLLNDKKELFDKGIISRSEYETAVFQKKQVDVNLNEARARLNALLKRNKQFNDNYRLQMLRLQKDMEDLENRKNDILAKSIKYTYIVSGFSGIVQEVIARKDVLVSPGEKLFTISSLSDGSRLDAVFFIPFNTLEQVTKGMAAHVAPFNVDKNRYGQILAGVTYVSEYPASNEYIAQTVNNDDFVNLVTAAGPVYMTRATLLTDSTTKSGLKWTSLGGAPYKIKEGTICEAEVIVDYYPPISYVIPWFKKFFQGND